MYLYTFCTKKDGRRSGQLRLREQRIFTQHLASHRGRRTRVFAPINFLSSFARERRPCKSTIDTTPTMWDYPRAKQPLHQLLSSLHLMNSIHRAHQQLSRKEISYKRRNQWLFHCEQMLITVPMDLKSSVSFLELWKNIIQRSLKTSRDIIWSVQDLQ